MLAPGMILFCIDISKFLVKTIPAIAKIFSALGQALMIILFLHLAFVYALKNLDLGILSSNLFILFILSTTFSFISYMIIIRFSFTRAIFLGSAKDFEQIFITKNQQFF
ncbi:MAG: hypothetical protein F6K23_09705 [Okeania sp. SIO2C9]|uniref:hypothetical protein n=1 Tax=Okeania sp. SIO2C9 TaxID=2607791 RepID=UPI0013C1FB33|nr:hypothetical protein [Okeania sp. SIO2C9]NEQ73321.1 hypothetical protein [Okeania sp. SIO2C9]